MIELTPTQTLINASSENMSDISDETIDFIITSPPYWNLKDYGSPDEIGKSSYEEYLERMNKVWSECYRVAKTGCVFVINVNSRRHQKKYYPIAFDIVSSMKDWNFWDHVIWYIPNALPQPNHYMERLFDNKYESCLVFIKGTADEYKCHKPRVPQKYGSIDPRKSKNNPKGRCIGNIIKIPAYRPPNIKQKSYHIAAYPEELVSFFLSTYTDEGDTVLDPFVGSGTTLKVCNSTNRKGIGYELNPNYIPVIRQKVLEEWNIPDWTEIDILSSGVVNKNKKRR